MSKIFKFLLIFSLIFLAGVSVGEAAPQGFKKGVAQGTFMMQGYSGLEALGTLRFFAEGAMAEESSLSYVDDAYISLDNGDYQGNPYELKGTFSGGPNGVATFVNGEGLSFSVPLKNGRTFDLNIPGVQVHMTVADPSIFELSEDELPEEYDPDAPLTDSGVKISDLDGQVEIACPPDLEAWDVLKRGRVIYNHCHIKTGEDSAIEISFPNSATCKIKAETEFVINEARKEKTKLQLIFGKIWTNVKKMANGEEISVQGSQAVAGIKGTTFEMIETGQTTTLRVIEGAVQFTDSSDGQTEIVQTGEELSADLRGLGEKTKFTADDQDQNQSAPINETENKETYQSRINYLWWLLGFGVIIVIAVAGVVVSKKRKVNK